jgi:tritrans,polycis-undecaprenyl-diphosphate synthase [geranylgeranyl-diphosphate specific]
VNLKAVLYKIYERLLWRQIKNGPSPHHIGLIVDGNRRFARVKGLVSHQGHMVGSEKLEEFLHWCWELDIRIVTLFGFSTENYKRTSEEVDFLMGLILQKLKDFQVDPLVMKRRVKIRVIGRREYLSDEMNREIDKVETMTRDNDRFQLNIAISYGGRAEIVDAVKRIASGIAQRSIQLEDIDEELISQYMYTEGIPDPDLIIRTSGERRLSGFLLWQSHYSELYFSEVFWPAFRMIDFWRAIRTYQQRERRFGK